ncbi:MAG: shikimate kinase [Candidatus Bathyarchaeia archaeon]
MKTGEAIAFGAATIINAMATGKGAAFGINLWTKAKVTFKKGKSIKVKILPDSKENPILAKKVIEKIFKKFNINGLGAYVETKSNIPIARGLKSSSVAANAIALAATAALKEKISDLELINLGVEAALEAKVTVTGAFDDACASYFGNIIVTDNIKKKIEAFYALNKDYNVLIYVPKKKSYTFNVNINKIRKVAFLINYVYNEALKGNFWEAMSLNGLIYSTVLDYKPEIAMNALLHGAIAAGLSGKGPAVIAVAPEENVIKDLVKAWSKYKGELIKAKTNREKAYVIDEP